MAVGAIRALHEAGLSVPEDISVFGYDDIPLASYFDPPLSTMRQDMYTSGSTAVQLLNRAVEHPESKSEQIRLPAELVIDHSVQVDFFSVPDAFKRNADIEFQRNRERYEFLRWGQKAFKKFRVVPPATGIVHQVNLEYLATVVQVNEFDKEILVFPDSLVGTDSHTTMINGLGVIGWGVGGIEAEAVMLGQPLDFSAPDVIGVKLYGELMEGVKLNGLFVGSHVERHQRLPLN